VYAEAAGNAPLWSGCIDFGNASLIERHVLLLNDTFLVHDFHV
jgi:hypothetical protein